MGHPMLPGLPKGPLGSPELPLPQRWGHCRFLTWAFLGCLSLLCPGRQQALAESITESMPPEVPARPHLTLPPDINQFLFSSFISTNFLVGRHISALSG